MTEVLWWARDAWLMAGRNLRRIVRAPDLIFTMAIAPVMFFVFFRYVFGGAIVVPFGDYTQFLIPGLLVGVAMFVSVPAISVSVAADLRNGVMDRFRSLPMTRVSVLFGHAASESVRYLASIAVTLGIGVLAGFGFYGGVRGGLVAIGLLLLWGFALAWVGAVFGLLAPSVEAAQMIATTMLAPFGFISSVYVPAESMPWVMQVFAVNNPITHMSDTVRSLFAGTPLGPVLWSSLIWMAGITAVFGALAVWRLRSV